LQTDSIISLDDAMAAAGSLTRGLYFAGHDLDVVSAKIVGFMDFLDRRQRLMVERLSGLLGVETEDAVAAARSGDGAEAAEPS
jgi:hypothetical protein